MSGQVVRAIALHLRIRPDLAPMNDPVVPDVEPVEARSPPSDRAVARSAAGRRGVIASRLRSGKDQSGLSPGQTKTMPPTSWTASAPRRPSVCRSSPRDRCIARPARKSNRATGSAACPRRPDPATGRRPYGCNIVRLLTPPRIARETARNPAQKCAADKVPCRPGPTAPPDTRTRKTGTYPCDPAPRARRRQADQARP